MHQRLVGKEKTVIRNLTMARRMPLITQKEMIILKMRKVRKTCPPSATMNQEKWKKMMLRMMSLQ